MQRDDLSLLIEIAQQQRKTATTMLLVAVQSRSTAAEMVDEASVMWNRRGRRVARCINSWQKPHPECRPNGRARACDMHAQLRAGAQQTK